MDDIDNHFFSSSQAHGKRSTFLAVIFDREISSEERARFEYLQSILLGNNEDQRLLPEVQSAATPTVLFDDNLICGLVKGRLQV